MISELRTYTINKGAMDAFLEHFEKFGGPLHAAVGIKIEATWVNRDRSEFIWIRSFDDEDDRTAKAKAFQEERAKRGIVLGDNIAKMEVKEIEPAVLKALSLT
jgi:hypothetical protein